ncbi:hypothetical protein ACFW2K_00445 [Streptomyces nigra]|jgi:hypothetical protein|uniref:hypothetical protein n=1 Tax=Streptomyces TaxID=1883 RepID=UPI000E1DFB9C|nr:hypothetical protein [Streptomyces sp. M7]RDS62008.1 hypothetical protein DWC19_27600 [Streptomyces sp. M7]
MQGHGYTQPVKQPPSNGTLVFLRVLFVAVTVFSFGLLTFAMMLRLAIVTRRALDWCLFVASIVVPYFGFYLIGSEPGDEINTGGGYFGLLLVLGGIVAGIAYYLAADIRHFQQARLTGGYVQRPPVGPAYGYPRPASPYTATTVPSTPHTPVPSTPHTPVPPVPRDTPVPPPPQRPAPARIDQVRAELDELSDYLRRQDGRPDDTREGGK